MHYHCVGVGCGPSNLSVASLLYGRPGIRQLFLDKKQAFSWHDGMLINGASLQVSLFKDLVTLADPTNRFSFISYLHSHNRLYHFLNAQFDHLLRKEFREYLAWAAQTNENVCFGEGVTDVSFNSNVFVIETTRRRVTADNVVVAVGTAPKVPSMALMDDRSSQFHVEALAGSMHLLAGKEVAVIGGGQSGAEAMLSLLELPRERAPAALTWISRRENFFPIDDTPFTNEFFTPSHSEFFYQQASTYRRDFLGRNVLASDGVSAHTLRSIYQRIYALRYLDPAGQTVHLLPYRNVNDATRKQGRWEIQIRQLHDKALTRHVADVIIWATGFEPARMPFLASLAPHIERVDNEFKVDRHFRASWDGPSDRGLFLLNSARNQRGLADPNLSLTAWRAQIVVNRILGLPERHFGDTSFVDWGDTNVVADRETFSQEASAL